MARINLLPWRAERRKARQKEFVGMLGLAALGGVLASFLIVSWYSGRVSSQEGRNEYLRAEITKVDAQIKEIEELDKKKAKLLARKEVIEQLQANRSQMVHLFDSLVRTIPDGVTLTSIKQEGEILTSATTFRFDGSDLMPGKIGAGSFWTGMVDFVGGKSAQDVADGIQKSWDAIK